MNYEITIYYIGNGSNIADNKFILTTGLQEKYQGDGSLQNKVKTDLKL